MKQIYILLVALSIIFTACSKDDNNDDLPKGVEKGIITAVLDFNNGSYAAKKASIDLSVPIGKTVSIDWGDGTTEEYVGDDTKLPDGYEDYNILLEHTYSINSNSVKIKLEGYMTKLDCGGNTPLISLDVSKNTALTELLCRGNNLTSLDVSKNIALTKLDCGDNSLTVLDVNTALTYLDCGGNQLTSLDVSKNVALTYLNCYGSDLTSLDVSKNTALTELECRGNQLTSLDVSKNIALTKLKCYDNQLTSLDVSKNTALTSLDCSYNRLTNLDVSKNTALTSLRCYGNQLTTLDASKNTALTILSCSQNQFSAFALNKIYTDLPQGKTWEDEWGRKEQSTLSATNNPGYEASNKSIARNKGWKVE